MKTILVVYTDVKIPVKDTFSFKHYVFNTNCDDLKVGDLIQSKDYTPNMMVVEILNKCYNYYNPNTGELYTSRPDSTFVRPIKELIIVEPDFLGVLAYKI